jgi:hypothetical protein
MIGNVEIRRPSSEIRRFQFWMPATLRRAKDITPLSIRFATGLGTQFFLQ